MSEKTVEEKKLDKSSVLEGIGSSKLYLPLSTASLDGVITGPDANAFEMAQWCLRHEGCVAHRYNHNTHTTQHPLTWHRLSVGPSAGLNVLGAAWLASLLGPGNTIVTILCDVGANYHSRDTAWLASKSIAVRPEVTAEQLVAAFDAAKNVKIALPNAIRKV